MPTANEVDNRPVAVGKWPRHHHHSRHPGCGRRKCGSGDNCVHKYGNNCVDVLLKPELLHEIYGERGIFSNSSNPLLEFCLDGGYLKGFDIDNREELSALLEICSDFSSSSLTSWAYPSKIDENDESFQQRLERICQTGCDINVQSSQGLTALHFIINGCSKESFDSVFDSTCILLRHGFDVRLEDVDGNSPLNFISKLLDRKLFREALELSKIILQDPRCDSNSVNTFGRSLLSQSVTHGDDCVDLTRLLLNNGASVFPFRATPESNADDVTRERDASAFTWYLRTAMRQQDLSASSLTLKLLCDAMAVEPELMRTHVLSTMLHLGQQSSGANSSRLASLFIELKSVMAPYWRQPLPLRCLCVNRIRRALGPKHIATRAQQLNLPSSLIGHLHLN